MPLGEALSGATNFFFHIFSSEDSLRVESLSTHCRIKASLVFFSKQNLLSVNVVGLNKGPCDCGKVKKSLLANDKTCFPSMLTVDKPLWNNSIKFLFKTQFNKTPRKKWQLHYIRYSFLCWMEVQCSLHQTLRRICGEPVCCDVRTVQNYYLTMKWYCILLL